MSYFFRFLITLYWKYTPNKNRVICLYSDSCSQFVYRQFKNNGTISGLKSFFYRYQNCSHGYILFQKDGNIYLKTKKGIILEEDEINKSILRAYKIVNDIKL